jgi:ACT domain-containing protein
VADEQKHESAARIRIVATDEQHVIKLKKLVDTIVGLCKANGLFVSSEVEDVRPRRGRGSI